MKHIQFSPQSLLISFAAARGISAPLLAGEQRFGWMME
jgi:hypothetical protein